MAQKNQIKLETKTHVFSDDGYNEKEKENTIWKTNGEHVNWFEN